MWIFRLEYKRLLKGALARGLITALFLAALLAAHHVFRIRFYTLEQALNRLPEELAALFGFREGFRFLDSLEFFDFLAVFLQLYFAGYAAYLGAESLHGEEQRKSIFYLLSRPIQRWKLMACKAAAAALAFALAAGISFLSAFAALCYLEGNASYRELCLSHMTAVYAGTLLMGMIFIAAGVLYSVLAGAESYAGDFALNAVLAATAAGLIPECFNLIRKLLLLAGRNINSLQGLSGKLQYFNLLSPAGWVNPLRTGGGMPEARLALAGGAVIVLMLAAALILYNRKEFD